MSAIWADVLIVLVFILLGAVFVAAEIALVSLRESQVSRLADRGTRGRVLASLVANPNRFLASVQVGVTVAGFLSAGFGASRIAPDIEPWLVGLGLSEAAAATVAFILVTAVIVYVSLVIGELAPKRLALQRAESISLAVAIPTEALARVSRPFIVLLSFSTDLVVRALGGDPRASREQITEAELRDMVATHAELGVEERRVIDDVFDAGDRELREVMVPRTEMDFLDAGMTVGDAIARIATTPHSRYPVIRGSVDDVTGFVHVRDLLLASTEGPGRLVASVVRPLAGYPGTRTVLSALAEMRRAGAHIAIVVDEYGGTAGMVTLEDLVEELVGQIHEPGDAIPRDGSRESVVDGLLNIEDFADVTGFELPEGPYETAAGFVVSCLGRLPDIGDVVEIPGVTIEVVALDGRRASRLRVIEVPADLPE